MIMPDDCISLAGFARAEDNLHQPQQLWTASEMSDPSAPILDSTKEFTARCFNIFLVPFRELTSTDLLLEGPME
jgi:hypothetical protein